MVEDDHNPPREEFHFLQIVSMFQMAAMQQLGKIMNPVTNEIEKDLEQAKFSIDTIEVLKQKTKGNLSDTEAEFLDKVLFELQMNYVEELESSKRQGEKTEDGDRAQELGDTSDTEESPPEEDKK